MSLMIQVIRSSNGLLTMTGMMLAILSGDLEIAKRMSRIQSAFADCLPELLPVNHSRGDAGVPSTCLESDPAFCTRLGGIVALLGRRNT